MNAMISSIIESLYSLKMYRFINIPLSLITGIFPLSLSEILLYVLIITAIVKLVMFTKSIIRTPKKYLNIMFLKKSLRLFFLSALLLYLSFLLLWGFNYYRIPVSESMGLPVFKYSKHELAELCSNLIKESNSLRREIKEDRNGVIYIEDGSKWVLNNAYKGYDVVSGTYIALSGKYGTPKPVILSELMCYTGITGIYFPFTGEANVNIKAPLPSLPHIVTHEMAHQRGYAREDEANFIAYLACIHHPNIEFKYSGLILALTHSMNMLYKEDQGIYNELKLHYSEGLKRDLIYISSFWKKYEGPVERISNDLNDAYLKSNNQKDGVKSYGRMVDLLISYHKKYPHNIKK